MRLVHGTHAAFADQFNDLVSFFRTGRRDLGPGDGLPNEGTLTNTVALPSS